MKFANAPLSTGIAGRRLNLSSERVRQLIASGELAAHRDAGGRYLIDAGKVDRLAGQRDAARCAR